MNPVPAVFLFLSVGSIAMFSFVTITTWSDARRKEREAFYKSETAKKLAEHSPEASLAYLRLEEENRRRRVREGLKLGGLITFAAGVGAMALFAVLSDEPGLWALGLVPVLVGLSLIAYVYLLAPREKNSPSSDGG